jgi:RNA polymerase sigma-70 factor (sigma-E family)
MDDRLAAFDALCRTEYPLVVRTAYLITGDREEAADVAQEAFARAFQHWRKVRTMDRPGAWLQRVASNLAISWRRRNRFWARAAEAPERAAPDREVTDDLLLIEGLQLLTPAQRAAIVLRYYADQSVEQTARALGKRPGTVRALTSQGVARLRDFLADDEEEARDAVRD